MILALVIFATTTGPVATSAGRAWFRTRAECEAFIASTAVIVETQRLAHEAALRAPVLAVAVCHDLGVSA
jgi:hypothetical protein